MLIRKDIIKLALPIIIEQIFVVLLGTCNTMMAGHISEEAVSAIGMVDTLNNMFIAFFAALSVGATVVVSQHIGKKNLDTANETAKQAIISGILVSCTVSIIIWMFRGIIIDTAYSSASDLVKYNTNLYLGFTIISYPFIAAQQISNGILRGSGDTKTPMKITICMNIVNIILGYILIFGIDFLHIKSLGILGAALAITIARAFGCICISRLLLKGNKIIKVNNLFKFKFNKKIQLSIFNIGIPAAMEQLIFNAGKLIVQVFIVTMGTESIAANSIASSVVTVVNVPGNALCLAATTLIGQYIGKDDVKGAKSTLIYMVTSGTLALLTLGAIVIPIAGILSSFYTNDVQVIDISVKLIRTNNIALIAWGISFILSAGLKGAGDTRYTMMTSFIGMWFFRIVCGYILGIKLNLGVLGIWIAMYIDWIVRGIMYCIRLKGDNWLKHRI